MEKKSALNFSKVAKIGAYLESCETSIAEFLASLVTGSRYIFHDGDPYHIETIHWFSYHIETSLLAFLVIILLTLNK